MRYSSINMHFDKLVKASKSEVTHLRFMWADLLFNKCLSECSNEARLSGVWTRGSATGQWSNSSINMSRTKPQYNAQQPKKVQINTSYKRSKSDTILPSHINWLVCQIPTVSWPMISGGCFTYKASRTWIILVIQLRQCRNSSRSAEPIGKRREKEPSCAQLDRAFSHKRKREAK